MLIDLNSLERKLLLTALIEPSFKEKMQLPQTQAVIRSTYADLKTKLMHDEELHRKLTESVK